MLCVLSFWGLWKIPLWLSKLTFPEKHVCIFYYLKKKRNVDRSGEWPAPTTRWPTWLADPASKRRSGASRWLSFNRLQRRRCRAALQQQQRHLLSARRLSGGAPTGSLPSVGFQKVLGGVWVGEQGSCEASHAPSSTWRSGTRGRWRSCCNLSSSLQDVPGSWKWLVSGFNCYLCIYQ